jgi:hypothetical protein
MTDSVNSTPQKLSMGKRFLLTLKKVALFLFRLLIISLILGAVGVALYYGGPVLIDEYLLKDVKVNSSKIQEVNTELISSSEFFSQRLNDLQTRLEILEIQSDTDAQNINDLQNQVSTSIDTLKDHSVSLENLDAVQAALDAHDATLASLEEWVAEYEEKFGEFQVEISELDQTLDVYLEEVDILKYQFEAQDTVGTLRQELELLKVMELITRVRVSIGQENFGLAKEDLLVAQELITKLSSEVSVNQADYLADISQRLALAAKNLTITPDLVNEDLEIAWTLLLQGLPGETDLESGTTSIPTETPLSSTDGDAEPTKTLTPTVTPTPTSDS